MKAYNNAALSNVAALAGTPAGTGLAAALLNLKAVNSNAAVVYLQVFDAATAGAVTVGTTAPYFWLPLAVGATDWPPGIRAIPFANGIVLAVTTTPTGGTAPATAVPVSLFFE